MTCLFLLKEVSKTAIKIEFFFKKLSLPLKTYYYYNKNSTYKILHWAALQRVFPLYIGTVPRVLGKPQNDGNEEKIDLYCKNFCHKLTDDGALPQRYAGNWKTQETNDKGSEFDFSFSLSFLRLSEAVKLNSIFQFHQEDFKDWQMNASTAKLHTQCRGKAFQQLILNDYLKKTPFQSHFIFFHY